MQIFLGGGGVENKNQISSVASFGWGIACIRLWARSDQNSGFHGNR